MSERVVRIGGASGAWGDSPMAIGQLLREGVDYLIMDYLAEVTMSLLARAKKKSPEGGYPPDFVAYLEPHLKTIRAGKVRVVSNAGGMNPAACKQSLEALAEKAGVALRVAMVEGDDVMPLLAQLRAAGIREAASGAVLPDTLLSANAYLGALPILAALELGADIVITGRSVDSALVLGILMHEFNWQATNYNRLAAGSLAGHLLECGPQVTGGIFTDWEEVPDWHNIGYPIAECRADGTFVITKPKGTGGLLSPAAVAEQVLYEIGDPARYLLPDVTADFSMVQLKLAGPDRVMVSGASGQPPTAQYKVSATYQDGFRAIAVIAIIGVQAARKAERTARALIARSRMLFAEQGLPDFSSTHIEALGAEASYGLESKARETREVVLRLVVDHADVRALDVFARQAGAVGISFAQGTAGLIGGRPNTTPLIRLFTFFVDKSALPPPEVTVARDEPVQVQIPAGGMGTAEFGIQNSRIQNEEPEMEDSGEEEFEEVPLLQVAHARSGDKGDSSNIAIFCRKPEYVPCLRTQLTAERVAEHFAEVAGGPVERFEAPGLAAFNFVVQNALGGGGMASARIDPQGKSYGQRALEMRVRVPRRWLHDAALRSIG
jgi:hypothetical protein